MNLKKITQLSLIAGAITAQCLTAETTLKTDYLAEDFVTGMFLKNDKVKSVDTVEPIYVKELRDGWQGEKYMIELTDTAGHHIKTRMQVFTNGHYYAQELMDEDGYRMSNLLKVQFSPKLYKDENLIYGNKDNKKKIVIFSDFQCPSCKGNVPRFLEEAKKEKYSIYYYDYPLSNIHPNSKMISVCVKAAIEKYPKSALEILTKTYKVGFAMNKQPLQEVLDAFNKALKDYQISLDDIQKHMTEEKVQTDVVFGENYGIEGTPAIFKNEKRVF